MKKKKEWLDRLGSIDPAYIEEADPAAPMPAAAGKAGKSPKMNKKTRRLLIWIPAGATAAVAACLALCLTLSGLWLFTPFDTDPPDVSMYADSEYYAVINTVNRLNYRKPAYENNWDKIISSIGFTRNEDVGITGDYNFTYGEEEGSFDIGDALGSILGGGMKGDAAPPTSAPPIDSTNGEVVEGSADPGYSEVTDNQVEGVIEADLFKRSSTHIFYLYGGILYVYSIEGENSREVATYEVPFYEKSPDYATSVYGVPEMYLSADGRTVTIVYETMQKQKAEEPGKSDRTANVVGILSLDVSDPTAITVKGRVAFTGGYVSSRMVGGKLLLVNEFVFTGRDADFEDESTYLPAIDRGEGFESIPAEDIILPEDATHTRYTVLTMLDEDTLSLEASKAFFSYTNDIYVTPERVYLARVFREYTSVVKDGPGVYDYYSDSMTEIRAFDYTAGSFVDLGGVTVRGYIKDQYSLDEHDGILRIVTTTNRSRVYNYTEGTTVYYSGNSVEVFRTASGKSNASLYCIDLADWSVRAAVEDFAPPYEDVRSVRFDGNAAYVCTAIEVSDPVFFFDLSDLDNITVKDTGTIDGFSFSLVNLGEGYLLGIGRGVSINEFKVEIYEEYKDTVRSVAVYTVENAEHTEEYKAYYIDRENNLIGFGVTDYNGYYYGDESKARYVLLQFTGYDLVKTLDVECTGDHSQKRATLIDGYFYILGSGNFRVEPLYPEEEPAA